jgi:hypothetical protein
MPELPITVQEVAEKAAGGDVEAFLVGMAEVPIPKTAQIAVRHLSECKP